MLHAHFLMYSLSVGFGHYCRLSVLRTSVIKNFNSGLGKVSALNSDCLQQRCSRSYRDLPGKHMLHLAVLCVFLGFSAYRSSMIMRLTDQSAILACVHHH